MFRPGSPHCFARSINSILGRLLPLVLLNVVGICLIFLGLQLTVGYGDIVLPRNWRMLGPLESIIGALMWGVSVSLLFAAITRLVNREPQSSR